MLQGLTDFVVESRKKHDSQETCTENINLVDLALITKQTYVKERYFLSISSYSYL